MPYHQLSCRPPGGFESQRAMNLHHFHPILTASRLSAHKFDSSDIRKSQFSRVVRASPAMADSNEPYVVVGSQYCLPEESVLVLKEKMWSLREKAEICDGQGQLVFRTEEKAWDIKERKTIFNAQDEPVCSMICKVFSLSNTTYLCAGADPEPDNALLTAKKVVLSWSPILNVFLRGNTSTDQPDIILKGNFVQYDFNITTSSGRLLATVDRKLQAKDIFLATQTYSVHIKPNVDRALIMGLVAMADDIFVNRENDK
ncbi:unnamed protein product [Closterium sp. Yama58-4]|nr:unnamed protein product [Closterium sp. Yama58-4]